jgi:putative ABC transport system permease protein
MTLPGLLFANLFRHRTRTTLTLLSLMVAFLLFMLLRAIAAAFAGGVTVAGMDRLIVDAKYSMTDNLPLASVAQVRSLDGVADVAQMNWFGAYYQDPKNGFAQFVVDPEAYFHVYQELIIDPAVLKQFIATRIGVVASTSLAQKFGWHAGDALPLRGTLWPKQDGSWDWQFQFIGTFDYPKGAPDQPLLLLHYDYFNEAVALWARNQVGWLGVRVTDPQRLDDVASAIDTLFKNSSDPTRSVSQDEYSRAQASQFGDMGFISTMILSAVFFTIVLLTGNTALQSFRERVPELAVLKTLGFTDTAVGLLVLCEALLLCVCGAALGIALALSLEPGINDSLITIVGHFDMTWQSVLVALALALLIGFGIGLPPAWAARRLTIVDALRGH